MDNENLIIKILSGKANNTDIRSFNDWLNQSEKNEEEFYKLKNLWDLTHPTFDTQSIDINKASKSFFNNIKKRERENKTRKLITFIYRVAAILFIPLVLSLLSFLFSYKSPRLFILILIRSVNLRAENLCQSVF